MCECQFHAFWVKMSSTEHVSSQQTWGHILYNWASRTCLYMKDMWSSIDNWYHGQFCADHTNNARIDVLKKISASTRKIILYFWKMKMHSYSQKCQPDQQRLEVLMYLSLTYRFIFLYIFYLLECAHILCKTLLLYFFLIFKVTLLAIVSLEKWLSLLWAPKKNKTKAIKEVLFSWWVGGGKDLRNFIELLFPVTCLLWWFLCKTSWRSKTTSAFGIDQLISCGRISRV